MQKRYFSQGGEDYILWSIFLDTTTPGIFLDVGALDGIRMSNTLSFEEQGWTGVCVEAHPYYIPMLQKNRPKSIVVHAAVTNVDQDEITFYANMFGVFSSLDNSLENNFKKAGTVWFDGYRKVQVPAKTINTILSENNIGHVDVVSIDIEGTEIDALRGFNLEKYAPRILCIEAVTKDREEKIISYMNEYNYTYCKTLQGNFFFCKSTLDISIVSALKGIPIKPIRTQHPLKHRLRNMK